MTDLFGTYSGRRFGRRNIGSSALICAALWLGGCEADKSAADRLADAPVNMTIQRADDPVVARVNGTEIYRTDVQRAAVGRGLIDETEDLDPADPVFRTTLDELIDERLLALDAVRSGVADREEAQRRLAAARQRILGNLRVETYLEEQVTEAAVRDLYERQRALGNRGEERRARQIVVETEAEAAEVLSRLADEEDFDVLAAELSRDAETRATGGNLGWMSRDMVAGPLRAAIFQTPVGERAGPVAGPGGWYVIEVTDSRAPGQRSFEEVREDVERFMTFQVIDQLVTDLRDAADIERSLPTEADAVNEEESEVEPSGDE